MDVLEQLRRDDDVRIDGGITGGAEFNLGQDFSRRCVWSTPDPRQPFLTVTVTGYVQGEIEDRDGVMIAHLLWGTTFGDDREITYPDGYDADTTLVKYYPAVQIEAIGHTHADDPGSSKVRDHTTYVRDRSVGMGMPYASVAEAEAVARKVVEGYEFDPAQVRTY